MPESNASEWGKLQLGQHYQVIVLDIFRGLALAGSNTYEWAIVEHVLEQSWYTSLKAKGPKNDYPDPVPCKLNLSALARDMEGDAADHKRIEKTRKLLSMARASLTAKNILATVGDCVLPNKDVDEWTTPDGKRPLLSPAWRDYAARAQTRKKGIAGRPQIGAESPPPNEGIPRPCLGAPPRPQIGAETAPKQGHPQGEMLIGARASADSDFGRGGEEAPPVSPPARKEETQPKDYTAAPGAGPRLGADAADFDAAIKLLATNATTADAIGYRLGSNAHTTEIRGMEGWRFVVAARKILGPAVQEHQRGKWAYFLGIARNAHVAELDLTTAKPGASGRPAEKAEQFIPHRLRPEFAEMAAEMAAARRLRVAQ